MDKSPADLRASLDRNARRDGWSERVLLGGLFLEVALLLVFSKDKPWYETASVIFANFLVFAGVAGEAYFGGKTKTDAKDLQRISDELIALANQRATKQILVEARDWLRDDESRRRLLDMQQVRCQLGRARVRTNCRRNCRCCVVTTCNNVSGTNDVPTRISPHRRLV